MTEFSSDGISKAFDAWLTTMKDQMIDLGQRIAKEVAIPELDQDLESFVEEFKPDTLGEAMEMADAAMTALEDNPVIAKLLNSLESNLGVSIRSPLQMAQLLVSGGNSPTMRIAVAMHYFPSDAEELLLNANKCLDYARSIFALIEQNGGINAWRDDVSNRDLPDEVLDDISYAKTNLIRAIKEPYNDGLYTACIEKLREASGILENLPITIDIPAVSVGPAAAKIAIQSITDLMKKRYNSIDIQRKILMERANIIMNTKLDEQYSVRISANIQEAISQLRELHVQMVDPNLNQTLLIPKYLIAINTIYNLLQYSKPTLKPPPPFFPGSTFVYPDNQINAVMADIRKLYLFSTKMTRIDLFPTFLTKLEQDVAALELGFTQAETQLNLFWSYLPGMLDFISQLSNMLNAYGLDGAISILQTGDIGAFMSLDDLTSTSSGLMFSEFSKISLAAAGIGLYNLTAMLEDVLRDMKPSIEKDLLANKVIKNEKTAKWRALLEKVTQNIDKLTNVVATVKGTIDGISALI